MVQIVPRVKREAKRWAAANRRDERQRILRANERKIRWALGLRKTR